MTTSNEKIDMRKYLGYKFFKELNDGSFDIKRVIKAKGEDITILEEDGREVKCKYTELKGYTPLKPYGAATFNIIESDLDEKTKMKDVMVCIYKLLDLKMGDQAPYAICRQGIHDFFSDLTVQNPEMNQTVGICINRDNCPTNINYQAITACDRILETRFVNIYRDDNIESILKCVSILGHMNIVCRDLYEEYCKYSNDKTCYLRESDEGWCKSLRLLLEENNFIADLNSMMDIVGIDFTLADYLNKRDDGVDELNKEALLFFDEVFKVNAVETRVIKYNYGIDMSKFNNTNYQLLRDNQNKVYLVVYLVKGEFLEKDLEAKMNELNIQDRLRLSYFDKYSKLSKLNRLN